MMKWSVSMTRTSFYVLFGPFAIGLGQHVVSLAGEDGCRRGIPSASGFAKQ
jgi:hypothetical protein